MNERDISRRDFLKLTALASAGLILPREFKRSSEPAERLSRIFDLYTPLAFDTEGNLVIPSSSRREKPFPEDISFHFNQPDFVVRRPTLYSQKKSVESNLVSGVKLLVVHFDGADRMNMGRPRTAQNTINGLNGKFASTHWCVDEYPISPDGDEERGFGIIQSQNASGDSQKPYQAAHVLIGINRETKAPDITRIRTMKRFKKLGINSNLEELIEKGVYDYDKYSVGFEQVGARFSIGFPSNFPCERQIANALSLTIAVMKEFGLGPWDVVGHSEIQDKDDPGAEFMASLRFLLGVAGVRKTINPELVFEGDLMSVYFDKIRQYLIELRGEEAYRRWESYVGFEKFIASL